jgi:hypothetical protein
MRTDTFVDVAMVLIAKIPAIVNAVTKERFWDAKVITFAFKIFSAATTAGVGLWSRSRRTMYRIFVATVGTILFPVAFVRIRDASAAFALKLVFAATLVGTSIGFVGFVATVVVTIAIKRHSDAVIISALIFVGLTSERSAALVRMFVTGAFVSAIIISVAKPRRWNASSRVVALELVEFAVTLATFFVLIRPIVAVGGAVASPGSRDAMTVFARKLVLVARVTAMSFVRMIATIIVFVTDPGVGNAFRVFARKSSRNACGLQRRSGTTQLVRVIPAIVLSIAYPRR